MEVIKTGYKKATLTDWCIVMYPEIYDNTENPEPVYAKFNDDHIVALLGKAASDPRCNPQTGIFADGHRLVTSPIIRIDGNRYFTANTVYTLDVMEVSKDYQKWCYD